MSEEEASGGGVWLELYMIRCSCIRVVSPLIILWHGLLRAEGGTRRGHVVAGGSLHILRRMVVGYKPLGREGTREDRHAAALRRVR